MNPDIRLYFNSPAGLSVQEEQVLWAFNGITFRPGHDIVPQVGDVINMMESKFEDAENAPDFWSLDVMDEVLADPDEPDLDEKNEQAKMAYTFFSYEWFVVKREFVDNTIRLFLEQRRPETV
ncbi:hypothetical protein DYBT9275_03083 [Dyadobacter sp. CECT 9275]|uniref:Uncharacterized protein n=1 Tax=Dyadobacter helix TaxID=2822344 RepID=A0A916NCP1_9BACT|nr:hypothetical protein [Dyadobacter sp. CECT 9275]CAG5003171.1 hypothetical protein DYBT9275_03083 [Dyadobacter sp. CECT 9275]